MIFLRRTIKKKIQERIENNLRLYRAYIAKLGDPDCTDDERRVSLKESEIHMERLMELRSLYEEIG